MCAKTVASSQVKTSSGGSRTRTERRVSFSSVLLEVSDLEIGAVLACVTLLLADAACMGGWDGHLGRMLEKARMGNQLLEAGARTSGCGGLRNQRSRNQLAKTACTSFRRCGESTRCEEDVEKPSKNSFWDKWATEHECEETHGGWVGPLNARRMRKINPKWTAKHANVAFQQIVEGSWTRTRWYDIGWADGMMRESVTVKTAL